MYITTDIFRCTELQWHNDVLGSLDGECSYSWRSVASEGKEERWRMAMRVLVEHSISRYSMLHTFRFRRFMHSSRLQFHESGWVRLYIPILSTNIDCWFIQRLKKKVTTLRERLMNRQRPAVQINKKDTRPPIAKERIRALNPQELFALHAEGVV